MKVVIFVLALAICVYSGKSRNVISQDEIEKLFKKIVFDELTEEDITRLNDASRALRPRNRSTEKSLSISSLKCVACRGAIELVFWLMRRGFTNEQLTYAMTKLCTFFEKLTYAVCYGVVSLNMPVLSYIISNTPEATANTFCSLLLQYNVYSDCEMEDKRFEWGVKLPPPNPNVPSPTISPPIKIALITDLHIDPLYEPYGVADCNEPTCCRIGQKPRSRFSDRESLVNWNSRTRNGRRKPKGKRVDLAESGRFDRNQDIITAVAVGTDLTRQDIDEIDQTPAGYWGDYRNCDTPVWAFENTIDEINKNNGDIDLVYYVGDSIDHHIWETSCEHVKEMNSYVVEKIRNSFGENVLVLPSIGNHEAHPVNVFAPPSIVGPNLNITWLYDSLADKWGKYLTEEARGSLRERGGYSILVRPGLRVISINNNVAQRYNWWVVYDPLYAKRYLEWLVRELHAAELAGERVHILAHIPPGMSDLTYTWTREYNRIVNRFEKTIAAEFNGHTHYDQFKIFYDDNDDPVQMAWNVGGVNEYINLNPNYKIAIIDGVTYEPENIRTYIYNLTEANLTPNKPPRWFELYDMRRRFLLPDLSAQAIDRLVTGMVTSHKHYLDYYSMFFTKASNMLWPYCDVNCKLDNVCQAVVTVLWERHRCDRLKELYYNTTVFP